MTIAQKAQIRLSEIRQRINTLLAQDGMTDAETSEVEKLTNESKATEVRYRAALVAEQDGAERAGRLDESTGEATEIRRLLGRASLGRYMRSAVGGQPVDGAEAELRSAYSIQESQYGGVPVPLAILAPAEDRASSTTSTLSGGEPQRSIMQRLFGRGIADALGVRFDSVPAGRPSWPLLTNGAAPAATAEDAAAAAPVAPTFVTESLRPKRISARYVWTIEQAAEVSDIEAALRRDLSDALMDAQQRQLLNGNGTAPEITGIYQRLSTPADESDETDYAGYVGTLAQAVDGIHATDERQVNLLFAVDAYRHAAQVIQTGSGESATEGLMRRGRSIMATNYASAAASMQSKGNILHAGNDAGRGDSIAAVWPAMELIRDPYTDAASGRVRLTIHALWDAYLAFRSAAYVRVAFKLG